MDLLRKIFNSPVLVGNVSLEDQQLEYFHQLIFEMRDGDEKGRLYCQKEYESGLIQYQNGYTSFYSHDKLHEDPRFEPITNEILRYLKIYCEETGKQLPGNHLRLSWLNINLKGSFHDKHFHDPGGVSGTLYLTDACILRFWQGFHQKEFKDIQSNASAIVLFPGELIHSVPLYSGDSPRLSIAFNSDSLIPLVENKKNEL